MFQEVPDILQLKTVTHLNALLKSHLWTCSLGQSLEVDLVVIEADRWT